MSYKGGFQKNILQKITIVFNVFKYYSFRGYTTNNFPLLFYGQIFKKVNKSIITKFLRKMDLL